MRNIQSNTIEETPVREIPDRLQHIELSIKELYCAIDTLENSIASVLSPLDLKVQDNSIVQKEDRSILAGQLNTIAADIIRIKRRILEVSERVQL